MVDSVMNRLGLGIDEAVSGLLDGLVIETLLSHLSCADEDHVLNMRQLELFSVLRSKIAARRYSLANSAGICLGHDYAFDLTRLGLAPYGGIPRAKARGHIAQVDFPQAQIIHRKQARDGAGFGNNEPRTAETNQALCILTIGYAEGYIRVISLSEA